MTIDLPPDQVKRETADTAKAGGEEKPGAAAPKDQTHAGPKQPDTAGKTGALKEAGPEKAAEQKPQQAKDQEGQGGFGRTSASGETPKVDAGKAASNARPASPAGRGGGSMLGAGVAGGVIALALAGGLQWAGILPGLKPETRTADPAMETLRQQVAALEDRLDDQQGRLEAAGGVDAGADVGEALSQASQRADALDGRISELDSQLATLQDAVSSGAAGDGASAEALAARLSNLEAAAGAGGDDAALQEVTSRIATLQADIAKASEDTGAAASASSENAAALSRLSAEIESLRQEVAKNNDAPRMALVIAASALKSAVERGAPFAGELDTYAAIAPDAEALAPLREHAAKGVPSRTTLAAQVPEFATRIVAAANRASGNDGGIIDNLMSSARSLVVVRPVGSVEGNGVDAIAARFEAAVIAGDYQKALAEYETLPDAGKQAAGDFAQMLAARHAADEALDKALSDALKGA
ncbi:phage tail protein [Nitratireductor pacificus]|uniref:phage tail protein n=1 Tax=Nitratireductor pacificus TaxID=1231180 RepID=UPI0003217409|nr:phage tail protein [Nitratireductor pacificus]